MLTDLSKAVGQLRDPKILKLLLLSLVLAAALLVALAAFGIWLVGSLGLDEGVFGWSFLNDALSLLLDSAAVVIALLLFPAASIALQSLFLDGVADAVEAKYYPHLPPGRRQRIAEIAGAAIKLALVALGLNLLLLFVWLFLLLVAPPIAPIPFYLVNGYLLGREYFELAGLRRMTPVEAATLRKQKLGWNMADGVLLTFLFTVPILNLAGPIIAAAYMTHRFHRVWKPSLGGAVSAEA